ncbi:MAG: NAD(P)-dependent alcohol dehydrogenase [Wenzhouxiangellaceae bacterium]
MKAYRLHRYGSVDHLQLTDVEQPTPAADEVLIKVKATAINDWDWGLVNGSPFYIRLFSGLLKPRIEIIGVDISGEVVAVGERVTTLQPGDPVYGDLSSCGFGGFAEWVCAPEAELTLKPDNLSHVQAAAIPHAAALAWQSLSQLAGLRAGQRLLVNGAGGGVGALAVQMARLMGVDQVVGVDSADKAETMQAAGYSRTIDYREHDFTRLNDRYDVILDTKTNRPPRAYLRALKQGGVYVTVGGQSRRLIQLLLAAPLLRRITGKRLRILGLQPNQGLNTITPWLESGELMPVIDGPYPWSELPDALRRFGAGRHQGKVVIAVDTQ